MSATASAWRRAVGRDPGSLAMGHQVHGAGRCRCRTGPRSRGKLVQRGRAGHDVGGRDAAGARGRLRSARALGRGRSRGGRPLRLARRGGRHRAARGRRRSQSWGGRRRGRRWVPASVRAATRSAPKSSEQLARRGACRSQGPMLDLPACVAAELRARRRRATSPCPGSASAATRSSSSPTAATAASQAGRPRSLGSPPRAGRRGARARAPRRGAGDDRGRLRARRPRPWRRSRSWPRRSTCRSS